MFLFALPWKQLTRKRSLEDFSQLLLGEGKPKLEDVKPLYFQPSDFKRGGNYQSDWGARRKDKLSFVSLARQIEGAFAKKATSP